MPGFDLDEICDGVAFARALTVVRERAGRTVREVARDAGIPSATAGGYVSGRHLPPLSRPDVLIALLTALGVREGAELDRWRAALLRVRRSPGPRPTCGPVPYRGLQSFQPEDADWFFGRADATRAVVDRLAARIAGTQEAAMLAVIGPSGSGKSSLLRAGVIPALRAGMLSTLTAPRVGLFTPGAAPLRSLAAAVAPLANGGPEEVEDRLRTQPAAGGCWLRDGGPIVLIADQFEEALTSGVDAEELDSFVRALRGLAAAVPDRTRTVAVILGMRADFYAQAARQPGLLPGAATVASAHRRDDRAGVA